MFDQTTYSGSEGGPPVSICAEITALMGTLDCDIVVTFQAIPGTKTGMTMLLLFMKHPLILHNDNIKSSQPCTRQLMHH